MQFVIHFRLHLLQRNIERVHFVAGCLLAHLLLDNGEALVDLVHVNTRASGDLNLSSWVQLLYVVPNGINLTFRPTFICLAVFKGSYALGQIEKFIIQAVETIFVFFYKVMELVHSLLQVINSLNCVFGWKFTSKDTFELINIDISSSRQDNFGGLGYIVDRVFELLESLIMLFFE